MDMTPGNPLRYSDTPGPPMAPGPSVPLSPPMSLSPPMPPGPPVRPIPPMPPMPPGTATPGIPAGPPLKTTAPPPTVPPPPIVICEICGSQPAIPVSFAQVTGWIIWFTHTSTKVMACHDCGTAIGRRVQNRTLWRGWWGVFAALANLVVIVLNSRQLFVLRRSFPADPVHGGVPITNPRRLDPGRPIWLRSGMVVVAALFAWVAIAETYTIPVPAWLEPPQWEVGACVTGGDDVHPVSCSSRNTGYVIAESTTGPDGCPLLADRYAEFDSRIWCIVTR